MASRTVLMTPTTVLVRRASQLNNVHSKTLSMWNLRNSTVPQSKRFLNLPSENQIFRDCNRVLRGAKPQQNSYQGSILSSSKQRRSFHQLWRRLSQHPRRDEKTGINESTPTPKPIQPKPKSAEILQRLSQTALPPAVRHENIYTIPNILTFSRLLAAPAVGYFIIHHQALPCLLLFFYAGVTDAIDGYLARRFNQQTVVGTVIDPMADKALMTISVVALGITGVFPWWLATVILGRDIALAISAIYFRWISLPPPKTMARYWDFSLPSAEVHPTEISKINTLLQLLLVGNAMLLPVLPVDLVNAYNLQGVFEGWQFLVAGTTVWSGLSYVYNKDAVKILSQEEVREKEQEKANKEAAAATTMEEEQK